MADRTIPRFGVFEEALTAAGAYATPYAQVTATVTFTGPDGVDRTIPLFWDGGNTWRMRFAPDAVGAWRWRVASNDAGLHGRTGAFHCVPSTLHGGMRAWPEYPLHLQYQDGTPCYWFGDTAWALFANSAAKRHDRAAAYHYLDVRAAQGFTVIQTKLLNPQAWPNEGGQPFDSPAATMINPAYWQEVDRRLAYLLERGMAAALYLAWWNTNSPTAPTWINMADDTARLRYVRYIAARYSAYNVCFLVAGEWDKHDGGNRPLMELLGRELRACEPHGRLIGIHPNSKRGGVVRQFAGEPWVDFGDYQQNYYDMHRQLVASRQTGKPVVHGEYAFYLRDQDGDGVIDKENSDTLAHMRQATWDVAMAGSYFCTGWGNTYWGGHRDPDPFDVDAPKHDDWEAQVQHVRAFFTGLPWWTLAPHDHLLTAPVPRSGDLRLASPAKVAPPPVAYWALADLGRTYVAYVRGCDAPCTLALGIDTPAHFAVRRFDPRTGAFAELPAATAVTEVQVVPPDAEDWVFVLTRTE